MRRALFACVLIIALLAMAFFTCVVVHRRKHIDNLPADADTSELHCDDKSSVINDSGENSQLSINTETDLFIIPVGFGDEDVLSQPDRELHFGTREAKMIQSGARIVCPDLPADFTPATVARQEEMHYQTIVGGGKRYIPLFTSYAATVGIFGENIRLGVISYETAMEFCRNENFAGVVLGPGTLNHIIPITD